MTFEALAKEMSRNEVFVASIFYGHAKPSPEDIAVRILLLYCIHAPHSFLQALSKALAVDEHSIVDEIGPHWWPNRGLGGGIPTDPGEFSSAFE
jgi:cyanate lyase